MEQRGIPHGTVEKEEFGELLEIVAPAAARAKNEEKRCMLRDLLLNVVTLEEGASEWESAKLAAELISDLEPAALALLAAVEFTGPVAKPDRVDLARREDGGVELRLKSGTRSIAIPFEWLVVEHAYRKISSEPRLVTAGAHGRDVYEGVALTSLGDFLISWARDAEGRAR